MADNSQKILKKRWVILIIKKEQRMTHAPTLISLKKYIMIGVGAHLFFN
jgi:hypothetical protein